MNIGFNKKITSHLKKNLFLQFMFCFSAFLAVFLFSCTENTSAELKRENLFSLSYGVFEDDLNLFNLTASHTNNNDTQIFMKEGLFYISNSGAKKVLKLSSFGDLLTIFYNPEANPKPSFIQENEKTFSNTATRTAIEYYFNRPSLITVTDSKNIFVVDTLTEDRIEYDHEENLALKDLILSFNEKGEFVDFIGQEGTGGTPFPSIERIYSNNLGEIIVVCRTQKSLKVYWYNSMGVLLYKAPFFFNALPNPYTGEINFFATIDKIIPDYNDQKLYVKIDYYIKEIDSATKASAGIKYDRSSLYFLNIKTGRYESHIDIEPYEGEEIVSGQNIKFTKVYEMLGITQDNHCYFITPQNGGYAIAILDIKSKKIYRRNLSVNLDEMVYNVFNLSQDGIISAILAEDGKANIVWWRTDLTAQSK